MIGIDEFWNRCQDNLKKLMKNGRMVTSLYTQNCAIAYTIMELEEHRREHDQRGNDKTVCDNVVRIDGMGKPDRDVVGCVRDERRQVVQEEARDQQEEKCGQGQEGGEEGKAEEQAMSDLCHMRKMERGRVLYCLDYIMRSLNDEYAQEGWISNGVPDGTMCDKNFLTEEQVEDHAEFVDSQAQLDDFVALAARTLFSEVYPDAWAFLKDQFKNKFDELMRPERCVLT